MKWLDRINRALKRGYFTEKDNDLANDWTSCMISERPQTRFRKSPLTGYDEPMSERLRTLGMDFWRAVESDAPEEALTIRKEILRQ